MHLPELQLASPLSSLSPFGQYKKTCFPFFELISMITRHLLFYKIIAVLREDRKQKKGIPLKVKIIKSASPLQHTHSALGHEFLGL